MNDERITMQELNTEELCSMIRRLAAKIKDKSVLQRVWKILERQYAKKSTNKPGRLPGLVYL